MIGNEFIAVFDDEARKIFEAEKSAGEEVAWLVQGTLYPDVIESSSVHGPRIRSRATTMWVGCRRI